ncbi:MAG: hypothetical protein ACM3MG_05060 [Bacillota bacterium]
MIQSFSAAILGALLLGASLTQAAVWHETQSWTPEWEQRYSTWIQNNFNEDIFIAGNYKGIPTDCADAVYLARLIFSYENRLPFIIKDSTGGSGSISNQMTRWDDTTDSLQRVRKFMLFVGDITSTKTLPNDTYPVAINRDNIRSGTVWSRPRITKNNIIRRVIGGNVKEDPGHAEIVKDVTMTGVINLIGSTVPKDVRKLNSTSSLVFMPIESSTGFRNWKQPSYYSLPDTSLPGFSLEQFNDLGKGGMGRRKLNNWINDVQGRLAITAESKDENIARQVGNICNLVNSRVDIVQKSELYRQKLNGRCMNADEYDSYSTPSRDKRIKTTVKQLIGVEGGSGITAASKAKSLKPVLSNCPDIEIAPGYKISLYDFVIALLKKDISSNPNDSFAARWGLESSSSNSCPKYE